MTWHLPQNKKWVTVTYISLSTDFALQLWIMSQSSLAFNLIVKVCHCDLYSWSIDFALYLEDYLMYENDI